MFRSFSALAIAFGALAVSVAAAAQTSPRTAAAAGAIHRGVNVLGYDPLWEDSSRARFRTSHFRIIRDGGFDFVRINLQAFRHMDAQNRLPARWFSILDKMVAAAREAGLSVILDEHDFEACAKSVPECRTRLLAFWEQVAPHYARQPQSVLFELLNEPHGKLDDDAWNDLLVEALGLVRRTNPERTVVIGPSSWNSFRNLEKLRLPSGDHDIVVTIHYYEPFNFTHQGASWTDLKKLHGVAWGSAAERAQPAADFAKVADWSRINKRPILLGEFGAYDASGTPLALRTAYIGTVARAAEANGFSWAHWQFDRDFELYDIDRGRWVDPIKDALIPAERQPPSHPAKGN
ncbi:glycoside hydrolase family 5 protein [Sphingomonas sp. 1P08PE]|uniref:glycoside hydrolase family 5 protein n=1 Tax=Sphingomonas sp. 1P08PE TaxID=554122 RepID=UPI0039A204F0